MKFVAKMKRSRTCDVGRRNYVTVMVTLFTLPRAYTESYVGLIDKLFRRVSYVTFD